MLALASPFRTLNESPISLPKEDFGEAVTKLGKSFESSFESNLVKLRPNKLESPLTKFGGQTERQKSKVFVVGIDLSSVCSKKIGNAKE